MKTRSLKYRLYLTAALALSLTGASSARADVHLPTLFSDGAVLQRGMTVPVWGTADAGESVTVTIKDKTVKATADASGKWNLKLPVMEAGGPFELTVKGKNTLVLHQVAVGEVWIASGQSNMEFPLKTFKPEDPVYGPKSKAEIATINDPMLRMFTVAKKTSPEAVIDNLTGAAGGSWQAAAPENADKFSAVAYHFARELRDKLKVPVGIIHTSWGGTPAEAWTSRGVLEADPKLNPIVEKWKQLVADYPANEKIYNEKALVEWKQAVAKANAEGKTVPKPPRSPQGPNSAHYPATLFNAMINPLIPYGIQGAIWYQGESNSSDAVTYQTLFPSMIQDWRSHWHQGDFPFLFVQLANFQRPQNAPSEGGWGPIREAQLKTLSTPNTGMACAIDLADPENPGDIHPHNKREVGRRLSLLALANVYHQPIPSYSGPLYSSVQFAGNQARLNFSHTEGGLAARGDALKGFAVAGTDGKFVWADAKIEGNTVVVSSAQVPQPAAVRYGWASNPIGNLYNKEGLPASPFRTDGE